MIEVKNVTHRLGGNVILDNVSLQVSQGSIMGLVGINGAGKTTLLRLMSGVYIPNSGEIFCDGISILQEESRKSLFYLPDDPYYTVYSTGKSLFDLYKVFYPKIDHGRFVRQLESFGLDEKKPLRNFSKGMRRQLYIALALAVNPTYLLLDEVFDGLDPLARLSFKRAINVAVEEDGIGVLISSHSLRELEDFCDSYALIDHKTIASSGDIAADVNRYCKFQLAFSEAFSEDLFANLPVASLEKTGRFARVVLLGDQAELQARLEALHPVIVEQMPMDFEEMFIYEVGKRGYEI